MKTVQQLYQSPVFGVLGMAVIWALGWGLGYGGIMEAFVDPRGEILDMWPMTLGIPGLMGGVIFFIMLRLTEGGNRFEELPLARTGTWGAVSGLLLFILIMILFPDLRQEAVQFLGIAIVLSTIAAVVTELAFRMAVRPQSSAESGSGA